MWLQLCRPSVPTLELFEAHEILSPAPIFPKKMRSKFMSENITGSYTYPPGIIWFSWCPIVHPAVWRGIGYFLVFTPIPATFWKFFFPPQEVTKVEVLVTFRRIKRLMRTITTSAWRYEAQYGLHKVKKKVKVFYRSKHRWKDPPRPQLAPGRS